MSEIKLLRFDVPLTIPNILSLYRLFMFPVIVIVSPLIKFGKIQSFHLYSIKAGGYLQGIFFILLFFVAYIPVYFYFMVNISLMAFIENLVIQLLIPEMRSDVKGIYWVLKDLREGDG